MPNNMSKFTLDNFLIEEHVKLALKEDFQYGDITTDCLIKPTQIVTAYLNTRENGILCGCDVFKKVFAVLSDQIKIDFYRQDGDSIAQNDQIAKVTGDARHILIGERTALNYIQRMSGIATETNRYVQAIKEFSAKISDTRKTTPMFRVFEKYAAKVGGAKLHRFCLSDCIMIKDNHIRLFGNIESAIAAAKANKSHTHKIEVECDKVYQVEKALNAGAEIILLDNMSLDEMKESVKIVDKRAVCEASGGINLDTIKDIAATGVDIISSSAIVACAKPLDIALDM